MLCQISELGVRELEIPVTCSIGIAMGGPDSLHYTDYFNQADQALYRAKAEGKNNCVVAT